MSTPIGIVAPASRVSSEGGASWLPWKRYWELLSTLSSRTLKTRYRGSILGVFWSLSNPLLMTGVYSVVFGTAFAAYYDHSIFNYVFATFVGLSVLNLFSQTTSQALTSVVGNGGLLNKVKLPVSLFPMSFVASNFFQFLVGTFPVLCGIALFKTHSIVNVAALIVPSLALMLVTIGFSLLTSSLYVYFRDLPYMYEIALFVIWITSPIFYPASLVPAKIQPFLAVNPLVSIVGSLRQIALIRGLPDMALAGRSLVVGLVCFCVGVSIFFARKQDFMDLL